MSLIPPVELLCHAAEALADLTPEVVFLGGAIVSLLITEEGGLPPRVTKDVDVAIELGGAYISVVDLDRRLLRLGFVNDMNGPTCRYLHGSTVVDVIPVSSESLGGVNNWYSLAIETAQQHTLPNGIEIKVIEPVCFLGTKQVAFHSDTREHRMDVFLSRDFGDMIRVIDGRPTIAQEVLASRDDLRAYLQEQFAAILKGKYIEEAIAEHVDPGRENLAIDRIRAFLT